MEGEETMKMENQMSIKQEMKKRQNMIKPIQNETKNEDEKNENK